MKRYRVVVDGDDYDVGPIDLDAANALIAELQAIVPEQSDEQIWKYMIDFARLSNMNLSHPSDYQEWQEAFDFMVLLTARLAKRPDGKDLWRRWELAAKGQFEVIK